MADIVWSHQAVMATHPPGIVVEIVSTLMGDHGRSCEEYALTFSCSSALSGLGQHQRLAAAANSRKVNVQLGVVWPPCAKTLPPTP